MCTFFFEEDAALGNHDGNITVYEAFALFVREGYRNVRIEDAL